MNNLAYCSKTLRFTS